MCQERCLYAIEIMKEIPGFANNFAVSARYSGQYNSTELTLPERMFPLSSLCNADKNVRIKIAVVSARGKELVSGITSVRDLESGQTSIKCNKGTTIELNNFSLYTRPSFIEYLRSGWAISLVAAIDYTASNGDPRMENSLHFLGGNNQYEKALFNVGMVVEPYDSDRSFPVFGFGGIPKHLHLNSVNHCFAVNGNPANPDIVGIEQIVRTYKETLPMITLGGPTLFAPLLEEFKSYVMSMKGSTSYQILLILTDGTIHDMPRSIDLICELSFHPCSVIIVGVGNADFSAMEELDGDEGKLRNSRGQECARDVV